MAAERVRRDGRLAHSVGLQLDKVLWPRDGYTKGDLIDYYTRVAPWLLPHVAGPAAHARALSQRNRQHVVFRKAHAEGDARLGRTRDVSQAGGAARQRSTYIVCNDEPTLVYVANLAAIVLHVWTSRVETLDEPDFVLFDLDPGEAVHAQDAGRRRARRARPARDDRLDDAGKNHGRLRACTLVVPLAAGYTLRHRQAIRRDRGAPNRGRHSATKSR